MDFYSAEEAREYTKKYREVIKKENIQKIKNAITKATTDGEYSISIYLDFPIDERILDEFRGLGYKVTKDNIYIDKYGYAFDWCNN